MKQNVFLVLEGCDGSGKSTIRQYIFAKLWASNQECLTVGQHGWHIPKYTEVIVNVRNRRCTYPQEKILEAYVQDKKVHYERTIRPHLQKRHVIADRYIYTDIVYHSVLHSIDVQTTYTAHLQAGTVIPDYVVFVDAPLDVTMDRIRRRARSRRWWEQEEYLSMIYRRYHEIFFEKPLPNLPPVIRVDNSRDGHSWMEQVDTLVLQGIFNVKPSPSLRKTPLSSNWG